MATPAGLKNTLQIGYLRMGAGKLRCKIPISGVKFNDDLKVNINALYYHSSWLV